jgi:aldehyde:ferredoxin oxidoreductase
MDLLAKKILYIDLNKERSRVELDTGLKKYIGGVGLGLKILSQNLDTDPIIFSVGPLNGFFPFCSKTSIVTNDRGVVEDLYIGGSLSSRISYTGLDSIVLYGKSKKPIVLDIQDEDVSFKPADTELGSLGLPGKRSTMALDETGETLLLDKYFSPPEKIAEKKLLEKNVYGISVTGSKTFEIKDAEKYEELYKKVLGQVDQVSVEKGYYPSCSGCPVGCKQSKVGEIGGNLLPHSLVACTYAEKIFSDIGIVFSCLNFLGYDYTHEDIENFPELIKGIMKELE